MTGIRAGLAVSREERRREPRRTIERPAVIGRAGKVYAAEILNVSTTGMNIKTGCALVVGQKLDIFCGGLSAMDATVAWIGAGEAGLHLPRELSLKEFEQAVSDEVSFPASLIAVGRRIAIALRTTLSPA